jgi:hypothetical protein
LVAADLGGGVIKQRIARPGQGKSGGFRTLIVLRAGTRAIFVHGFALKKLAAELLAYDDKIIARVVASGVLVEVKCDEKTIPQCFDGVDPRNRRRSACGWSHG